VFWKRSHREERRQKALDELFALKPAERRSRLDRAVAAGEVHADEVDSTLRLVGRLDALRVFTIHPNAPEVATAATDDATAAREPLPVGTENENAAGPETKTPALAVAQPVVHMTPWSVAALPRRKRVGVPVVPDADEARHWSDTAAIPLDALEAASRLVAHDKASLRLRRAAAAPSQAPQTQAETDLPAAISIETAEPAGDENWPSIAWLRP
jgi:hypothetical protein